MDFKFGGLGIGKKIIFSFFALVLIIFLIGII
jgi:hypothetical protein